MNILDIAREIILDPPAPDTDSAAKPRHLTAVPTEALDRLRRVWESTYGNLPEAVMHFLADVDEANKS